jgi:hypothetical protein
MTYGFCNQGRVSNITVWPVPNVTALSDIITWDTGCNGAVVTKVADPNGNALSTSYNDPLWRPTSLTDERLNTVNISYTPTTVESQMSFNGGASELDAFDTTDTLGRPSVPCSIWRRTWLE